MEMLTPMSKENNLFNKLDSLGFEGLSSLSLYRDEEKKAETRQIRRPAPEDYLFDRKVECPLCHKQVTVRAVKSSGIRIISRDTDFMTFFNEPNPLLYDAWVCVSCGYAALSGRFNTVTDKQAKLIKENITVRWNPNKKYPPIYDIDTALETHQLALLNSLVKVGKDSEKAFLCLKIAWLYRLKKDAESEKKFLLQAQKGFLLALEKEAPPIAGMDEESLEYLIGELYRRLGNFSEALKWLGRVLSNPKTKRKIKDMARDQKDLINKLKEAETSGQTIYQARP